eukprot:6919544-Prymnesium_polylepis.1
MRRHAPPRAATRPHAPSSPHVAPDAPFAPHARPARPPLAAGSRWQSSPPTASTTPRLPTATTAPTISSTRRRPPLACSSSSPCGLTCAPRCPTPLLTSTMASGPMRCGTSSPTWCGARRVPRGPARSATRRHTAQPCTSPGAPPRTASLHLSRPA